MSDLADWIERNVGHTCTPDQIRCLETVVPALGRIYNLDNMLTGREYDDRWRFPYVDGMELKFRGGIGSFDDSEMTRLVRASHENCVRVEATPFSHASTLIRFSARDPGGCSVFDRHPSWGELTGATGITNSEAFKLRGLIESYCTAVVDSEGRGLRVEVAEEALDDFIAGLTHKESE